MWHLTLLAITGASSYSHKGPLRPPKLMGKDKAVPVAVVENSMAARRDNPFDGLDLENATSASQNQKAVCEMERERAPWPPLPVWGKRILATYSLRTAGGSRFSHR